MLKLQRACIVDVGDLFDFAKANYGIEWNHACDIFQNYNDHDGYKRLESKCINYLDTKTDVDTMSTEELADRIVKEFIATLDVPEGYNLLVEG